MNRIQKLFTLMILSSSVFFIYQKNHSNVSKIVNIGDALSQGKNSFGVIEYGYIDYYKDYLSKTKKVVLNNDYSNQNLSLYEFQYLLKTSSSLKKTIRESNQVFLTLGYNDLLYQISINNNNQIKKNLVKMYQETIKEIKKYTPNKPIVIGYYIAPSCSDEVKEGLQYINQSLSQDKRIIFIDTGRIIQSNKYFSNPNSYYINRLGYYAIYKEILKKT